MMSVTVSVIVLTACRRVRHDPDVAHAACLELVEHVHLMLHVEPAVDAEEDLLVGTV